MRKSNVGKKRQPQVVKWDVTDEHLVPMSDPIPEPVAEPLPWEQAATTFMPWLDVNKYTEDAWLLFQAYHLNKQTELLQAILAAVTMD